MMLFSARSSAPSVVVAASLSDVFAVFFLRGLPADSCGDIVAADSQHPRLAA
jgi:hypothetical protein